VIIQVTDYFLSHLWMPKTLQVIGNLPHGCFVIRVGSEKIANVIGHLDKLFCVHAGFLDSNIVGQ
jgi:hypothetical protein